MVNLQSDPMGAEALAVRVCAGLFNRDTTGDAVYLLETEEDQGWLDDIDNESYSAIDPIDPNAFLTLCLDSDIVKGFIKCDFSAQQLVLPNIITIAAVLDAVPLDAVTMVDVIDTLETTESSVPLVFDAIEQFRDFSALDATRFVYEQWGPETTAMSKMDPGWETSDLLGVNNQLNPQLIGTPELGLTDYIVKERLFNFFLCNKWARKEPF